jgi:HNH endonuclease
MKLCHSDFFIVRAFGGKTQQVTPHQDISVQEQETSLAEEFESSVEPSGRNAQVWLKSQCLQRDNFRCVITGRHDRDHCPPEHVWVPTNCAHIIPLSLGDYVGAEATVAAIWTAITRYFPEIKTTRIKPEDLNVVENAITMASFFHSSFGRFDFSFDELVCLSRTSPRIYANAS